eukprot:jgi/Mesvir1/26101/Mv06820-RA.1
MATKTWALPPPEVDTLVAQLRTKCGTRVSQRIREMRGVPAVIQDREGKKTPITLQHREIWPRLLKLGKPGFLSRVVDLKIYDGSIPPPPPKARDLKKLQNAKGGDDEGEGANEQEQGGAGGDVAKPEPQPVMTIRALPQIVQTSPINEQPQNVSFLGFSVPSEPVKVNIPIKFVDADVCPGIRKGGFLNIIKRTLACMCEADKIPAAIVVDLSAMTIGERLVCEDIAMGRHMQLAVKDPTLPVCNISGSAFKGASGDDEEEAAATPSAGSAAKVSATAGKSAPAGGAAAAKPAGSAATKPAAPAGGAAKPAAAAAAKPAAGKT